MIDCNSQCLSVFYLLCSCKLQNILLYLHLMQSKDNTNDEGHTSRQDEDDEDKQTNNDNVELLHLLHHNTIIGLPVN